MNAIFQTILLKFFTKEKILAYAAGGLIALGSAGLAVDQKEVKDLVCKDYVKTEK